MRRSGTFIIYFVNQYDRIESPKIDSVYYETNDCDKAKHAIHDHEI
jgi:hypothetical protein